MTASMILPKRKLFIPAIITNVAVVNENGLVTAKGTGVATITAHVTIDGNTESGSFPIKVSPDMKPASITVNGKKVAGFNPDIHSYSYLLPASATGAPKVEATSSGSGYFG